MFCNNYVLLFTVNLILVKSSFGDNLGEVVFVHILYRHGERTPIEPYPNDPYKNISFWPVGWGELTDAGKRGHYELGKWLRRRYSQLLPVRYKRGDISVQSTDVDRTLMSAYSNLAGLYEPDTKDNWSSDIKWDPIPVHTCPQKLDKVLAAKKPCPRYEKYLASVIASEEFKKIDLENKDLYDYLNKNSGLKINSVKQLSDLYDNLYIEDFNNMTLPSWTKTVYPQPLKKWAEFGFSIACYNREMARLKVGPLISDMAMRMKRKTEGTLKPDRKAWVYSAHDITIANILQALRIFDLQCPPFRSLLLFELRKLENDYYVAIYYRNSSAVEPFLMQIPGCDKLCPFARFNELVTPLIPVDWEKECRYSLLSENFYDSISGGSFVLSVALSTTFLLAVVVVMRFCKRQYGYAQNEFAYHSLKMDVHS